MDNLTLIAMEGPKLKDTETSTVIQWAAQNSAGGAGGRSSSRLVQNRS